MQVDTNRAYAGDVVLMLALLALAGPWGAAVATVITLCRHSPIVVGAVLEAMDRAGVDGAPAMLAAPRVAALLPGAAPVLEQPRRHRERPERQRPATVQPGMVIRASSAAATPQRATAAVAERPRPAPQAAAAPTLERPRWLQTINDEPDQRPHTMILGPTRSGKTTMATAAMADRGGRAVVITPKLNPSNWRGAEVVTLDDDGTYAPIHAVLDDLEQEKRERIRVLRTQGAEALEPLTIVFDEIGELASFAPRAPEMMTQLSSIGAELKMRLIGIGTSDEALGVKRWKATRNNYVRVETNADRRATISDGVRTINVTPTDVVSRAKAARLRPWRGVDPEPAIVAPAAPAPDDLLAQLMAADVPPSRQSVTLHDGGRQIVVNVNQQASMPATVRPRRRSNGIDIAGRRARAEKLRQVRRLVAEGKSANEIDRMLPGERSQILALVRQAKRETGTQ